MTSVYSTALGVSATLAAGVSFPIAEQAGFGWRGSLALWAVPAIVAALAWVPQLRSNRSAATPPERQSGSAACGGHRSPGR
jgi:CP family cyanate transporter-like MFS transporter